MFPQNKGGQKLHKKTIEHYKGRFLNTKNFLLYWFFAIKAQT
jgi:hypothetical protein